MSRLILKEKNNDVLFNFSITNNNYTLGFSSDIRIIKGDTYDGEYNVIPNMTTQVLETAGKLLIRDVTVQPIPSNYGLIEWNGSYLKVS